MARVQIANLKGPQGLQGPRGLPGVNAAPADAAVAGYIAAGDSQARASLNAVVGVGVGQRDLLGEIAARQPASRLQIRHSENQELFVSSIWGSRHVTWQLLGTNAGDAFRPLAAIHSGATAPYSQQVQLWGWQDVTPTGTWAGGAGSVRYTTEVGASLQVTVRIIRDEESLSMTTYVDDRGGMLRVTLVGLGGGTVDVSTWAAAATRREAPLFANVPRGEYTLKVTFLGPDPAHAPSSGTARGWASPDSPVTPSNFLIGRIGRFGLPNLTTPLAWMSNREFAFRIRPAGSSAPVAWVPFHDQPTARQVTPPAYFVDGEPWDLAGQSPNFFQWAERLDVAQHITGRMPGGTDDLIEIWTTTTFLPGGRVRVTGRWKILAPVEVAASYVAMFPGKGDRWTAVVTSTGRVVPHSPADYGTVTWLPDADAAAYAMISDTSPGQALAVRVNAMAEVLRPTDPLSPPPGQRVFVEHRDAAILKVYTRLYPVNQVLAAGVTGRISAEWIAYDSAPVHADLI